MHLLQVQNFSYSIGFKSILEKVNLKLSHKKRTALRGENGAGKSTLLRCILHYAHYKDFIVWNKEIPVSQKTISYLGHELGLYNSLSLFENLKFFHSIAQSPISWDTIEKWVNNFQLQLRWDDPIYSLSRGMKQKVALVRALIPNASLLLLDEPFTGLDHKSNIEIREILKLISESTSILAVIHEVEDDFWEETIHLQRPGAK